MVMMMLSQISSDCPMKLYSISAGERRRHNKGIHIYPLIAFFN